MKRSTKFWFFIAFGVIILFLLILISSILALGERLSLIHDWVAYIFYGLAIALTYFLIFRPILIIIFSPTLTIATTVDRKRKRHRVYKKVAKRLLKHPDIPEVAKAELNKNLHDKALLKEALNLVYRKHIRKVMMRKIRNHAKTVMISTAISQNGRLDFFTVIVVNLRMIKEIVSLCGFRPSFRHLAKLTINVFITALIAEGLENLNITDILPTSTVNVLGEIPFVKPLLSSVTQGISNALLTLRIGIVTRKYLFSDENEVTQERIRFTALLEAAKELPLVIASGLVFFPKSVYNLFRKKNRPELVQETDSLESEI